MANNELSGPIVSLTLAQYFLKIKNLKKNFKIYFYQNNRINKLLSKNLEKLKKKCYWWI